MVERLLSLPRSWSDFRAPVFRIPLTLVLVTAISLFICSLLATSEGVIPPNDGVIELPLEGFSSAFLGEYGEALYPADADATILDVSESDAWEKLQTRYVSFGSLADPAWLRVKLRNIKDEPITVRVDTRRVAFKWMKLYLTPDGGRTVNQFLDYSYDAPFSNRPVNHRILVADVVLQPGEQTDLYVHYEGLYISMLPIRVAAPSSFELADKYELVWSALFYGFMLAAFFLTILTWSLTGWRLSVSLGVFLTFSLLSVWSVEGYIDQFLVPTKNQVTAHLTDAIYLWNYAGLLLLSRNIFDLKPKAPIIDRIMLGAINFIFLVSILHLLFGIFPRDGFVVMSFAARVSSVALYAVVGIWAVANNEKGGTIFTASAVLLTMAAAFTVFIDTFGFQQGGIPGTMRILVTIETIAFAIAIAQNVAAIRYERDAALVADLRATREKLRLNEALRDSQSAYERARLRAFDYRNRLQSVSHDILQPLSSLKAALNENLPADSAARKPLSEAFEYLQALANENLPAAKRAASSQDQENETPITLVLDAVVAMFVSEAAAKGIDLNRHLDLDDTISADPVLLMRAVSNLVANAIRYTSDGAVTVSAEKSNGAVTIEVSDTGPGLSRQQIEQVMQRGVSGEQSNGSGLGLSIVQDALDELGGSFELISTPGIGTTARCHIPVQHASEIG